MCIRDSVHYGRNDIIIFNDNCVFDLILRLYTAASNTDEDIHSWQNLIYQLTLRIIPLTLPKNLTM